MSESFSSTELALGHQIRALADAGVRVRDPNAAARAAMAGAPARGRARLPVAALATAGVVLLIAVAAVALVGPMGSSPATAQVGGLTIGGINVGGITYTVAVARSIDLREPRLTPIGEARQNSGFTTEGSTAYQVDDVDPARVLVMKLVRGEHDDAGSIGDYLVLVRGNDGFSLVCPYFHVGDPLAPRACH